MSSYSNYACDGGLEDAVVTIVERAIETLASENRIPRDCENESQELAVDAVGSYVLRLAGRLLDKFVRSVIESESEDMYNSGYDNGFQEGEDSIISSGEYGNLSDLSYELHEKLVDKIGFVFGVDLSESKAERKVDVRFLTCPYCGRDNLLLDSWQNVSCDDCKRNLQLTERI